ncbi:S8 family serine peptidase [Nonomuraea phyllanthi]|uniref:S8 family serine peptidase n=1 Tax=Nonomuraea phyllanthi TaxID=2219224 RepID=A0A5C4VRJ5_9ACTN|nr:S8 family serine peptidase [Nonomuraea phyllanthi]KAB8189811.1 S8 family serine peptidase [Nonomuraea phyllanthi]
MPSSSRGSRKRRLFSVFLPAALLLGTLAAAPAAAETAPGPDPKVDPALVQQLRSGKVEAAVVLRAPRDLPAVTSRAEARAALAESAEPVQDPVVRLVKERGDEVVNTFWLKNMVLVRVAPATLDALADLDAVERIIPNVTLKAPEEQPGRRQATAAPGDAWGIAKIGADKAQSAGFTGKGVRVAVLDTGIDATHPDLAGKLATDDPSDPKHPGGWMEFDADGRPVASEPHDSSFHGTHVAGTIAGGSASGAPIGVAPGAELMAGLVIPGGSGTLAQVVAGMQWALAPFAADGSPAGEPADIVSMSLGGEGYSDELIEPARNIWFAGAFPAFAIGNDCSPGQSSSPGNVYEAVAVGATDADDAVPDFSCGGVVNRSDWIDAPPEWPDSYVVPDVSAPGVDVLSAWPGGGYQTLSGTSMATPHVAGTVALMLQARSDLTVDAALEILQGTSVSDDRYGPRPNPRYGSGRIDAFAAVTEAGLKSGVRGVVTDERTRRPLAGVEIARQDGRKVETGADGRFELRLPEGRHELTLSRFGYETAHESVRVRADRLTDLPVRLERTRWGTISGRVTYGPTGTAVPGATVTVLDVPDTLAATTDGNGRYTIRDVPEGDYRVSANAPGISRSDPVEAGMGARHADVNLPRPPDTDRVSLGADGRQGNHEAWWPELSGDGSVVVFASPASNLDGEDTNGELDIFATDLRTRATRRVSVPSGGGLADSFSVSPTVSRDGRLVGFGSGATNLVPDDTNGQTDAFVHDRQTGTTELLSVSSEGVRADGLSGAPRFGADGRYAVFDSDATTLVPGDTNGRTDIFLRDRQTGTTERVSVAQDGSQAAGSSREPTISADGRYIAFRSDAANLVPGDDNGVIDTFVRDRETGTVRRITGPEPDTETTGPVISADGTAIAFSNGPGLGQLYVQDLATGRSTLVSATTDGGPTKGMPFAPSLSADGRLVAFYSDGDDLVEGDANRRDDVFVRDVAAGTTERISAAPDGVEGDGRADLPSISEDGRYVAFESTSANLVEGDTNRRSDVFVHDRVTGPEALFALSDLEVTPSVSRSGRVQVSARVTDVGELAGSYEAVLRVNGQVEGSESVELRPGRDAKVRFGLRHREPGTYTVQLGHLTARFTVR